MYASVPGTSPIAVRVSALVELGETEVEQARPHLRPVLDEHVGRLHVAVHDPVAVCVRERFENLSRDLDGVTVGHPPGTQQLAQRAAGHVLVGDIHMTVVTGEVVGADAALVPQSRRGLHLAHRACGPLPLAGDDLQRDFEARALVAGQPDRARAAAPEWTEGPVALEDELAVG